MSDIPEEIAEHLSDEEVPYEPSAEQQAIENALAAMGGREEWLAAYQGQAWAAIAMALLENNRQAYTKNLAEAAAAFVEDKSPEKFQALESAVILYRDIT
jgi:hypothetical protein